jgi:SprT protein
MPIKSASLSDEQIKAIQQRTQYFIDQANQIFNLDLEPIELRFDVSGAAWGYYVREPKKRYIRYNPSLFSLQFAEGLAVTVAHEVAHYVVDIAYPRLKLKPHGKEWKNIMRAFGIAEPKATHCTDVSAIAVRRQRRYHYQCACGETSLSATRHNRILHQGMSYRCRECNEMLKPCTN